MASSSSHSSYNSSPKWTYDVFLSFRREDTRKNFVDHLYTALGDRSIHTFKDDLNLKRGTSISPELIKAIEESRFAVVVFSRNYADSSWCLDELAKIVECKNSMDQTLVPVFYDVDPSEVRKQTGCYEEAFSKHKNNGKEEDQIQTWRNALAEAASISGWDLPYIANGDEAQCIKQIVGTISTNLACSTTSCNVESLIGMESRVRNVKSLLCTGSDDVRIIGILGMGGIGKTTVASAVFDDISNQFEGKSYVSNVREVSKSSGLHSLQEQILSDVLMKRDLKVRSVRGGIVMMRRLCHKRVLLVLDDVDHWEQLEVLAGNRDWFGKGSRIIITTRDEHLLVVHGVFKIYRAVLLNDDEALLLFSRYAFKSNSPPEEFVELSRLVVGELGRLPLALKVLGCFLYGRDMDAWKSTLGRSKHVAPNEILDALKISFDGLKNSEQQIFLDIACFFTGRKKDYVSEILDSFDFYPDIGLSVLIQKSLVTIENGTLQMHALIKEMGWNIVYQMDPKEPGRRSRLWLPEDVHAVLREDTGTEAVEIIKLVPNSTRYVQSYNSRALRNMKKLRLLEVGRRIRHDGPGPEYLSNELRWISWEVYPSQSLPASFQAEKLVCLSLYDSRIVELWRGKKILDKLKIIDLRYSEELTETPDLSGAPNLERLNLRQCERLKEVHPSLGDLKRLTFLDLADCVSLERFLFDFNMTSLEILILSRCEKLEAFPQILGNMKNLTELYLDHTAIKEVHPSIAKLTGLVLMNLSRCCNLRRLPSTIGQLKCLKTLNLFACSKLEELPETLGEMESVEELFLNGTAIIGPPSSILLMKSLKTFFCDGLDYPSYSELMIPLSLCPKSSYQNLSKIVRNLNQLSSLEVLRLCGDNITRLLDSLCQFSRLKVLELKHFTRLEALQELPSSIAMLIMDDCRSLESLGDLFTAKHEWLHEVSFQNCFKLTENEQRSTNISSSSTWPPWLCWLVGWLVGCYITYLHVTGSRLGRRRKEENISSSSSSSSSCGFADKLLRTLLQGRSVVNHQFSILVLGREIPDWFVHQGVGEDFLDLQLSPNWHKRIVGFAMCCVLKTAFLRRIEISIGSKYQKMLDFNFKWGHTFDHVWMGYISLEFFGQQIFGDKYKKDDWVGGTEESFLRIRPSYTGAIKKWGINVVYRDDVEKQMMMIEEQDDDSSQSAGNFGFFPTKEGVGHFFMYDNISI